MKFTEVVFCDSHCLLFIPQDDKDLVHEFVNNDGLDCLIKVGAEADQNYQNYILRGEKTSLVSVREVL